METIKMINLKFGYNETSLFLPLNYTFKQGEMIAIVGNSGIGKTTFLKTLCGFIKPISGQVKICGLDINLKNNRKKIPKIIGFLTQENSLIEFENVFNNLYRETNLNEKFLNRMLGIVSKNNQKKIIDVLTSLNISDKILTRIDELSGGQKQRVNIARILLNNNKIILADEPTSNLDLKSAASIIDILFNIKKFKTIFIVIHNIHLLSDKFDKVIFFENNKINIIEKVNTKIINELKRKMEDYFE
ncbi:ATP-binding cassette domain-containing protein [Mycoplasma phocimorsus]|uniref:ATP-binding cassette domain-containing protein n=1 Tax=Mycoplasma phocimorsus TaxID=3045839 RepID=UPI0024BF7591|nr:ABC transporter ATP-binding protein [Mycoplasma phocimorsus]MDJ1648811.1 ABC transporter ATP-binding protein [Mycoplasma phocimorsus]